MGLFSFTQEIAMDLGTANTIITTNGKIVVDEPSVVALDRRTDKMIAVGDKAKMMHEKTHENIRTIRPLRDGVIADFYACEQMIRGLIKMVNNRNRLFSPSLRMVIGVPSGSTEVELRAVRDALRARFRRAKNTEQSRGAIRSQVVLELENKLAREIITGYGEVSVEADADNPTVCLVDFSFTVAHGLNQIWLSAHITV